MKEMYEWLQTNTGMMFSEGYDMAHDALYEARKIATLTKQEFDATGELGSNFTRLKILYVSYSAIQCKCGGSSDPDETVSQLKAIGEVAFTLPKAIAKLLEK